MKVREITPADDAALVEIIRYNLKNHGLDIPGTVYFDGNLDHLSDFYLAEPEKRAYFVLTDGQGRVSGGIGLAEFEGFTDCAELQKLYLTDAMKGSGLGYEMLQLAEDRARALGYRRVYLETHTNLQAALHIYERAGFVEIPKPDAVVHSTMNRFYIKDI